MLVYIVAVFAIIAVAIVFRLTRRNSQRHTPPPVILTATPPPTSTSRTAAQNHKDGAGEADDDSAAGPPLTILYGSQTGTAEDFANTMYQEAKKIGFNAKCINLEDYHSGGENNLANEKHVMFLVATYGEGEPTDTAKEFWDWLFQDDHPEDMLSGVKYTVFGLGNRTYEHFNAVGKGIDKRMAELGAHRLFKLGLGDDDSSLEEDFNTWRNRVWVPLCKEFNLPIPSSSQDDEAGEEASGKVERKTRAVFDMPANVGADARKVVKTKDYGINNPYHARIVVNRELHGPGSDRSCRHIEIEIDPSMKYEPGDHLGVFAQNHPQLVLDYARRLGVEHELQRTIALYPANDQSATAKPILGPCTIEQALMDFSDLTSVPRKTVLRALAEYATDGAERDDLILLSSEKGAERYNKWVKDDKRIVLEILNAYPSVKPPIDHFLEMVPRMPPRYYSISSSLLETPGRVSITAVVVRFETPTGRVHHGVCTTWLAHPNQIPREGAPLPVVPIYIRKSNFRFPRLLATPLIMIGPGTGLAPFRSYILERRHLIKRHKESHKEPKIGDAIVYFGCRDRIKDFLYKEELETAVNDQVVTKLYTAFSREQANKVYVQDRMRENSKEIWTLISEKRGSIYVCGDAHSMEKQVLQTIKDIIAKEGGRSPQQADDYIAKMKKDLRYQTDCWF